MYLSFHGGHCCGVKHIWKFPTNPREKVIALEECVSGAEPHKRFAWQKIPAEKAIDRLDRYIEYMQKYQPNSLIEIFLIEHLLKEANQLAGWKDILLERGFVAGERFKNSNTHNWITMFTLAVGAERVPVAKEAPLRPVTLTEEIDEYKPVKKPRRSRSPATPMEA